MPPIAESWQGGAIHENDALRHNVVRSNKRGAASASPQPRLEVRVIPHKYAPINAATFVIYGRA